MNNSAEKPMHLRARMDRGGAKVLGPVSVLIGLAVLSTNIGDIIGAALLIYAGLAAFPATRMFVSRGRLGFTKWRAYAARLIWLFGSAIGLIAAYPL